MSEIEERPHPNQYIETLLDWPVIARSILKFDFSIRAFDPGSLIISDNPVIPVVRTSDGNYSKGGFETCEEIWFPTSSDRLLILMKPSAWDGVTRYSFDAQTHD